MLDFAGDAVEILGQNGAVDDIRILMVSDRCKREMMRRSGLVGKRLEWWSGWCHDALSRDSLLPLQGLCDSASVENNIEYQSVAVMLSFIHIKYLLVYGQKDIFIHSVLLYKFKFSQ